MSIMSNLPNQLFITNKAKEYADKVFTDEYVKSEPKNFLDDALKWFNQFNVNQEERVAFTEEINNHYNNVYVKIFGKERYNDNDLDALMKDARKLLDNCNNLDREIDAMKHGVDFLINEYNTNKRYFRETPGRVTIEDVIKTCFEFGWSSKSQFDYSEKNGIRI